MCAVKLWITTSTYRWPVVSRPSTYMHRTALRTLTPRRDQLVICGQYREHVSPKRRHLLIKPHSTKTHNNTNIKSCVRFQVLTAASMTFRVFWDVALCSAYCLHHGSRTQFWNVGLLWDYTAQYPRRLSSKCHQNVAVTFSVEKFHCTRCRLTTEIKCKM
jgi:hypothetical protein